MMYSYRGGDTRKSLIKRSILQQCRALFCHIYQIIILSKFFILYRFVTFAFFKGPERMELAKYFKVPEILFASFKMFNRLGYSLTLKTKNWDGKKLPTLFYSPWPLPNARKNLPVLWFLPWQDWYIYSLPSYVIPIL